MRQGDLFAGRYHVVRRAGAGGMGTVYEARDAVSNAKVALKTPRIDAPLDARAHARLLAEARALSEIRHPAVVRYVDHGVSHVEGPFLVMEWVVGETLDDRLQAGGVTPVEALDLLERLGAGLSAVHAGGVVHRDLKPSNVMLPAGDVTQAVVVDFGVARVATGVGVTATGDYVGTPRYMAPEQIRDARAVDEKTDVFALGCILFECFTGVAAFEGSDPVTVLARILFEAAPLPSSRRRELPPSIDALVVAMLHRDPTRRPTAARAEAFARKLRADLALAPFVLDVPGRQQPRSDEFEPLDETTASELSDEMAPPSFRLGTNAALEAARRVLPSMPGTFIGRQDECRRLLAILRSGAPVIAVWGGPGVGKTRLVIEAVRRAVEGGDPSWDAVVYAELGEARDADSVVRILATAARVSVETTATPELALASALGKLGRTLLIVDPIEHMAPLAGTLAHAFRRAAPRLQLIATSRHKGCPSGAIAIDLGALPTFERGSHHLSPSAELLLERMGHDVAGRLDPALVERAERLASGLEGNALAIELSARTAQIVGINGLLARLTEEGRAGTGRLEAAGGAMRSTLERSYDLLSAAEREAFAQCAVFRGGFTFDAAEAVIRAQDLSVLELVRSLREHSLLVERASGSEGDVRLAMPAAVRELAWEKLRSAYDSSPVLERHAAYYADHHARRFSGMSGDALASLERDADNLFAAADFCLGGEDRDVDIGFRALVALEPAILRRGAVAGYLRLLDVAVAWADARGDEVAASLAMTVRPIRARFDGPAGRGARARDDLQICLDDARRRNDGYREGLVLLDLGVVYHLEQNLGEARSRYEDAIACLESVDDPWALGRCLGNIGALCHDDGDLQGAARMVRQAIELLERAGEDRHRANFMGNLALIEQELGDPCAARELFERSLELLEPIRDARLLAIVLGNFGMLELEMGAANRALALHERAFSLLVGSGDARSRTLSLVRLAASLATLDRPALSRARLAQAARIALDADDSLVELVALSHGFVDLTSAREAARIGRKDKESAALASAKLRMVRAELARDGDRALRDRSDDVRSTLRILARLIAEREAEAPTAT